MSLHASAFRLGEDVRCGREERLRSGRLESQLEQSAAVPGSTEDLDDLRTPVGAHHDVARLQLDIRTAHPAGLQINVYAKLYVAHATVRVGCHAVRSLLSVDSPRKAFRPRRTPSRKAPPRATGDAPRCARQYTNITAWAEKFYCRLDYSAVSVARISRNISTGSAPSSSLPLMKNVGVARTRNASAT